MRDATKPFIGKIGTNFKSWNEELVYIRLAKGGNKAAEARIIEAHMPFVIRTVLKNYHAGHYQLSDYITEGAAGLQYAIRTYDENRGFKLLSYAVWWIRQYITKMIHDTDATIYVPQSRVAKVKKAQDEEQIEWLIHFIYESGFFAFRRLYSQEFIKGFPEFGRHSGENAPLSELGKCYFQFQELRSAFVQEMKSNGFSVSQASSPIAQQHWEKFIHLKDSLPEGQSLDIMIVFNGIFAVLALVENLEIACRRSSSKSKIPSTVSNLWGMYRFRSEPLKFWEELNQRMILVRSAFMNEDSKVDFDFSLDTFSATTIGKGFSKVYYSDEKRYRKICKTYNDKYPGLMKKEGSGYSYKINWKKYREILDQERLVPIEPLLAKIE